MEADKISDVSECATQRYNIGEATKLIAHPFDGDKRKLREFIENVDVFELVDPNKHILKSVEAQITGDARSNLMVRDLTHNWELVETILEQHLATGRTLDYHACKIFNARQRKIESIASSGKK
jgi:tRNA A58 N-methylase Trm61